MSTEDDPLGMKAAMARPLDTAILTGQDNTITGALDMDDPAGIPGWDEMTEAEHLGVYVAGTFTNMENQRDQARRFAARLEGELAEAMRHLRVLAFILDRQGTTFARDTHDLEQANQFLEAVGSPETPDETTEDH
jgi:hypothetical protein